MRNKGLIAAALLLSTQLARAEEEAPVQLDDVFVTAEPPDLDLKIALKKPWPPMPASARARWSEACVMWSYTVRTDGRTDNFKLLQARGEDVKDFVKVSLSALQAWEFPPQDKERHFTRVFNFNMGANYSQRFTPKIIGGYATTTIIAEPLKYPVCYQALPGLVVRDTTAVPLPQTSVPNSQ